MFKVYDACRNQLDVALDQLLIRIAALTIVKSEEILKKINELLSEIEPQEDNLVKDDEWMMSILTQDGPTKLILRVKFQFKIRQRSRNELSR